MFTIKYKVCTLSSRHDKFRNFYQNSPNSILLRYRGTKCGAHNNSEGVVLYASHVLKRYSERSALVLIKSQ